MRTIQSVVETLKTVEQNPLWHPEVTVFKHTAFVWHQLKHDPILIWVALFHDLGKIDTTRFNEEKGTFTSYGHEFDSLKYIDEFDSIIPDSINRKHLKLLVKNHMKIKYLDKMRPFKVEVFVDEMGSLMNKLEEFAVADDARGFWERTDEPTKQRITEEFQSWISSLKQ